MVLLKEYFESVLILCAFLAVSVGVSHPKHKVATRFGAGVLIICAILLPLVDILKDINIEKELSDYMSNVEEYRADNMIEAAFEEGIAQYLADEYDVGVELVSVMADGFELDKMKARKIYVTLSGEAALLDYKKIENEVEREFTSGGECEVSLKIG